MGSVCVWEGGGEGVRGYGGRGEVCVLFIRNGFTLDARLERHNHHGHPIDAHIILTLIEKLFQSEKVPP